MGVQFTSGASSSRVINGDCGRGQSVVADDGAFGAPVGRSIVDGGAAEESEALLNCCRAQRKFAVFEPVARRQ